MAPRVRQDDNAKQASAAATAASRPAKLALGERVSNTAGLSAVSVTLASSPPLEAAALEASARAETAPPAREAKVRERGSLRWPLWLSWGVAALLAAGWFAQSSPRPKPAASIEATRLPTPSEEVSPYVEMEPMAKSEAPGRPRIGGVPRSCADAQAGGLRVDPPGKKHPQGPGPPPSFHSLFPGRATPSAGR